MLCCIPLYAADNYLLPVNFIWSEFTCCPIFAYGNNKELL